MEHIIIGLLATFIVYLALKIRRYKSDNAILKQTSEFWRKQAEDKVSFKYRPPAGESKD